MRDLIFYMGFAVYSRAQNKYFMCFDMLVLRGNDCVRSVSSYWKYVRRSCSFNATVCAVRLAAVVIRRQAEVAESIQCLLDAWSLVTCRVSGVLTVSRSHAGSYPK
jgi:hypothetical protein